MSFNFFISNDKNILWHQISAVALLKADFSFNIYCCLFFFSFFFFWRRDVFRRVNNIFVWKKKSTCTICLINDWLSHVFLLPYSSIPLILYSVLVGCKSFAFYTSILVIFYFEYQIGFMYTKILIMLWFINLKILNYWNFLYIISDIEIQRNW